MLGGKDFSDGENPLFERGIGCPFGPARLKERTFAEVGI
ncbi:hypothetical protein TDIS_0359 [Thermosulfurimonas dismutans]|uniref:Uncharacterized protein n=1 Tax=Thermosulfurimonas dismutans TaxID=999894 RepID=A0A179D7U9_9BACT|nr:hypothetical protein TDIS_0359 [Thermosulfurimonas dismutans]